MTTPGPSATRTPASSDGDQSTQNHVILTGRVSGVPVETELPSGDVVVGVRLVVPRSTRDRKPPYVDTINCSAWTARLRRSVLRWQDGDVVALEGSLRRRFWRGSQGPQSRYEVELTRARRVNQATQST